MKKRGWRWFQPLCDYVLFDCIFSIPDPQLIQAGCNTRRAPEELEKSDTGLSRVDGRIEIPIFRPLQPVAPAGKRNMNEQGTCAPGLALSL